jgi:hypothetical protein
VTGRRIGIAVAMLVSVLIILNLLARTLDESVGGRQPRGQPGSSYATTGHGLAAYETLLAEYGHPVTRQRGPLAESDLDPDDTLVVLQPQVVTDEDTAAMLRFVTDGGRLVVGGQAPTYLRGLRDVPPQWNPAGPTRYEQLDPALGAARVVETAGRGSWSETGDRRDLVRADDAVLVTEEPVGEGSIVYVADPSFVANERLDRADNAAVALALAGDEGRRVVFAEGVHGYEGRSGLGAIPVRWQAAFLGIALAALAFVWSRGRRLGPPDRQARELPPPRALYVDALARTLARTGDRTHATEPLRASLRQQIAARGGLSHDASDDDVDRAARALGLTEDERAAMATVPDDDAVLALGRASARITTSDSASTDWRVE